MKTNSRFGRLGAFALGAVMLIATPTFAQTAVGTAPRDGATSGARQDRIEARHQNMKDHAGALAERLNLTDQQKQQIKALRDRFRDAHSSQLTELKNLRGQMRQARQSGDKDAAQRLRDDMKQKMQSLQADRKQLQSQISQVLTEEQRQEMAKIREEFKARHQGRGHGRHGAPEGATSAPKNSQGANRSEDIR